MLQDCEDFEEKTEQEKQKFLSDLDENEQDNANPNNSFNLPTREDDD